MYTPQMNKPKILSVTQLNFYIKSLIENDPRLGVVFITGEISNLTDHYRSGHIYLMLKDEKSVIKAVMFAGNARGLRFKPQDGMKVICRGRVALYEPNGQYQLYIEDMQPDGVGALALAYEQLKFKLSEKGLFDESHKKTIPKFPKTIGVVTSPTGAAIQDILNVLTRRFPCVDVVICPVLVQGDNAPNQLVNAVNKLDEYKACDVIIIGRGGGSIEDLWAFNSEELAYAIYNCSIPIISAVGHETDFTICDFVSDLRAPTPSAAAELAVPDKAELFENYRAQEQYINSLISSKIISAESELNNFYKQLLLVSPVNNILKKESELSALKNCLQQSISDKINKAELCISTISSKLDGLNPIGILSRGYTVTEKNGKILTSKSQLNIGDEFTVEFCDGKIIASVLGD